MRAGRMAHVLHHGDAQALRHGELLALQWVAAGRGSYGATTVNALAGGPGPR